MKIIPFIGAAVALKLAWVVLLSKSNNCRRGSNVIDYGKDSYPQTMPIDSLPKVAMQLEDTLHFQMESEKSHADAEWEALYPGGGLVYFGEPRRPFMPSMFHQLRCLDIIRRAVVDAETNSDLLSERSMALTQHCINYLRQMVLCRTDLDLEIVFGRGKPEVHPDLYQCRDWTKVYEEVEANQRMHAKTQQ